MDTIVSLAFDDLFYLLTHGKEKSPMGFRIFSKAPELSRKSFSDDISKVTAVSVSPARVGFGSRLFLTS